MSNDILFGIHVIILLIGFFPVLFMICDLLDNRNINRYLVAISTSIYIFVIAFFFVGIFKVDKQPWNYYPPYATEKIVSLNDGNQLNGHFHLRRGYIGEKLYYQYMVDLGSGGYKANKVGADTTTLYYDDDNCRVEWYEKERHWLYFSETEKYNKIYVPEGSITDDYMIDLQ